MQIAILSAVLLLAASKLNKHIKKHFIILCIATAILSAASYFVRDLTDVINGGYIGLAFFIVVMFQSAFKKGSNLCKKTLSVRKEYSILGFVFLMPHILIFLIGENQVLEWNGILSFIIMVPLFITSFIIIRKKLSVLQWKRLHLISYIAYILMFAHVIIISTDLNRSIYIVLAGLYLFLKIKNNGFSKLDTRYKKMISIAFLIITITVNIFVSGSTTDYIVFNNNQYNDGTYYAEAAGFKDRTAKVNVEIENDRMVDIEVIDFGGTEPHEGVNFEQSVHELKDQIIDAQSLDVDTISGATKSTTGLKNAVNNALKKAIITDEESIVYLKLSKN